MAEYEEVGTNPCSDTIEMEPVKKKGEIVIIAPHADDEIIGCFEILRSNKCAIVYTERMSPERQKEIMTLKNYLDNPIMQFFLSQVPQSLMNPDNTYYFPDPIYEFHPAHRKQGHLGEQMLRDGFNVIFYSIQMNAPYIHELKEGTMVEKMSLLDNVYPSQMSLWNNDAKYYLFEGRNKWIM